MSQYVKPRRNANLDLFLLKTKLLEIIPHCNDSATTMDMLLKLHAEVEYISQGYRSELLSGEFVNVGREPYRDSQKPEEPEGASSKTSSETRRRGRPTKSSVTEPEPPSEESKPEPEQEAHDSEEARKAKAKEYFGDDTYAPDDDSHGQGSPSPQPRQATRKKWVMTDDGFNEAVETYGHYTADVSIPPTRYRGDLMSSLHGREVYFRDKKHAWFNELPEGTRERLFVRYWCNVEALRAGVARTTNKCEYYGKCKSLRDDSSKALLMEGYVFGDLAEEYLRNGEFKGRDGFAYTPTFSDGIDEEVETAPLFTEESDGAA